MSTKVKRRTNDIRVIHGESVHDHAISNEKNPEITESMFYEDVIDVEVKEIEAPLKVHGLERTECLGLPEQKKVVLSLQVSIIIVQVTVGNW